MYIYIYILLSLGVAHKRPMPGQPKDAKMSRRVELIYNRANHIRFISDPSASQGNQAA